MTAHQLQQRRIHLARGLFRGLVLPGVGRWMRLCASKETAAARALVGGHGIASNGGMGYGHAARCLAYEKGRA
jgi:hypothetical protein